VWVTSCLRLLASIVGRHQFACKGGFGALEVEGPQVMVQWCRDGGPGDDAGCSGLRQPLVSFPPAAVIPMHLCS